MMNGYIRTLTVLFTLSVFFASASHSASVGKSSIEKELELAKKGNAPTQILVGDNYYNTGDYINAYKWYLQAAEKGMDEAQLKVGLMHKVGAGTEKNYNEAFKWLLKSAKQRNLVAEGSIGLMYYEGKGVNQNYKEALNWYLKAAKQGNLVAQSLAGDMYSLGKGTPINYVEAYKWYSLSATNGEKMRIYARDNIASKMTSGQIIRAQELATQLHIMNNG